MTDESNGDSHFETISEVLQTTCAKCGQKNSLRALRCKGCEQYLEQEEDDRESLSFLHSEGIDSSPKSGSASHKLKRLTLALQGVRNGELSYEDYRMVVGQVLSETRAMQEILEIQVLKQVEQEIPDEAADVMREMHENVNDFARACERMMLFDGSNIMLADEGLSMAESAIADMEATQKEAAELQKQYEKD